MIIDHIDKGGDYLALGFFPGSIPVLSSREGVREVGTESLQVGEMELWALNEVFSQGADRVVDFVDFVEDRTSFVVYRATG